VSKRSGSYPCPAVDTAGSMVVSQARELAELIAARYPDRTVHVVGDAAYVGDARATWTVGSAGPAG
jgi:hypothetical protein